jgi:hypothetical protein
VRQGLLLGRGDERRPLAHQRHVPSARVSVGAVQIHAVSDERRQLIKLAKDAGGKPRYSTNDNSKLAQDLDIEKCAAKCRSFDALRRFLLSAV